MSTDANVIEIPNTTAPFTFDGGVWWMKPGDEPVRDVATAMNALGARFITVTAYQLPGTEGFRLEYHWDLEGRLLGFTFNISAVPAEIESIYDLCEAADWIEREVREGFSIHFTGREYEPLLLREGDTPGVNLRECAVARPAAAVAASEEAK